MAIGFSFERKNDSFYDIKCLQACTNFYDDGVCKQECPPMQRYNQIKYRWERNPDGKYAYGATCVKDCPKHLLKDNGACVRACPPKKKVRKKHQLLFSFSCFLRSHESID